MERENLSWTLPEIFTAGFIYSGSAFEGTHIYFYLDN